MLNPHAFAFMTADQFVRRGALMPSVPAVYLVLIRDGDRLLEVSGYFAHHSEVPFQIDGFYHLYTGASRAWVGRMAAHIAGSAEESTLRRTLLSLERINDSIWLSGVGLSGRDKQEARLTNWLLENALLAVSPRDNPWLAEAEILRAEPSPLNIQQRLDHGFSRLLLRVRAQASPIISNPDFSGRAVLAPHQLRGSRHAESRMKPAFHARAQSLEAF